MHLERKNGLRIYNKNNRNIASIQGTAGDFRGLSQKLRTLGGFPKKHLINMDRLRAAAT